MSPRLSRRGHLQRARRLPGCERVLGRRHKRQAWLRRRRRRLRRAWLRSRWRRLRRRRRRLRRAGQRNRWRRQRAWRRNAWPVDVVRLYGAGDSHQQHKYKKDARAVRRGLRACRFVKRCACAAWLMGPRTFGKRKYMKTRNTMPTKKPTSCCISAYVSSSRS